MRRPRSTRQRRACRPGVATPDGAPALDGAAARNLDLKRHVAGSIRPRTVDGTIHRLVDELPEEQLDQARVALERMKRTAEERAKRDARDAEVIKAHLDELNAEAEDVLGYQADW